ncbi:MULTISPECIES: hypothetical protein [unclassified Mesorhizobium]|uniref:hypothetical protein n=1 Tax=unclassified Mesorhizobium TaxID=325217 RepID=UPI0015E43D95|nr:MULTISPECIES: hypothetical protein [unclassified Mesorhizobium]UCI30700.1 hypothetical protein FJW03_23310 [Mesorhizobium sp. B4-1-4]
MTTTSAISQVLPPPLGRGALVVELYGSFGLGAFAINLSSEKMKMINQHPSTRNR